MADEAKERNGFRAVINFLWRLLGKRPPQSPADPYAYVMAPLRHGPKGRSGAAIADIEDDAYRAFPPRRL